MCLNIIHFQKTYALNTPSFSIQRHGITKPSQIGDITLSFTDIGKACPVRDFYVANVSFNAIFENKFLAKVSEFTLSDQDRSWL